MPCRHGNADRALDPGVSGLVCAEFSRNCLFRQTRPRNFPYSSGFNEVKPLAFGLDGRFLSLVPSFPRRRLPSRATRREFYTKQEALGGDGCPPIGVSDGDDLPRIFFSTSPETHMVQGHHIASTPHPSGPAMARTLAEFPHWDTRQQGKVAWEPALDESTPAPRAPDLQAVFREAFNGRPVRHVVGLGSTPSPVGTRVGATAHNASSGPGIGTLGVGASHLSGHEDITRGPWPRCEADACSCPSPCLSSSLCGDTPQLVIRAKWAVQRKYPSRAMELCSSVCRPCRRWLWPLPS